MWDLIVSVPDHCLSFHSPVPIESLQNNQTFIVKMDIIGIAQIVI